MHSFTELVTLFKERFNKRHFPEYLKNLYDPAQYILNLGGKRIRPVCLLMGNELFADITPDAYQVGTALELFHNFTLIHDDIMDKAPLRRGMETVHTRYGEATALLAGDVMLIQAYECLNTINISYSKKIFHLFNKMAKEVCEGQQLDITFEQKDQVDFAEYLQMITLKTSVLLATSLQMGALLGGGGEGNQQHMYEFGKNLGIAFQIQDDYLDAFGDTHQLGKQIGGDIMANKKTFLLIYAMQTASEVQKNELQRLIRSNEPAKVEKTLQIFKDCHVDSWAKALKDKYLQLALNHLEEIAVLSVRKEPLKEFALFLMDRSH